LGHCHKDITATIQTQAGELLHTSNWYHITHQETLAEKLCKLSNMDNAFFGNSGAEANEGLTTKQKAPKWGFFVTNQVLIMTGIVKVAPFDC
jgi:acetylornithine/succinyldiaminopimelate/putrescine aminotransferase